MLQTFKARSRLRQSRKMDRSLTDYIRPQGFTLNIEKMTRSTAVLQRTQAYSKRGFSSRFLKRANKVQINKENINTSTNIKPVKLEVECPTSEKIQLKKHRQPFLPRRESEFFFQKKNVDVNLDMTMPSKKLQQLLYKNDISSQRCLLGCNIISMLQRFNFSRFELHSYYSWFKTLLQHAKQSMSKFKSGFEVLLNIHKITVRSEVIEQIFSQMKVVNFRSFLQLFRKIEAIIFRQNIIDYLDILFENINDRNWIKYAEVVKVFNSRMSEEEAKEISRYIYEALDREEGQPVTLKELAHLSSINEEFDKRIYRLYTKEVKGH